MKEDQYREWLEKKQYAPGTVNAQLHRVGRLERAYGPLDELFDADRLEAIIESCVYSAEDQKKGKENPSKIKIDGDLRAGLASYKDAAKRYCLFRDEIGRDVEVKFEEATLGTRVGLERDLQIELRKNISFLEDGLEIIDEGAERSVLSGGFIDITAKDANGTHVVIELKAGMAGRNAVGQILSYMGDLMLEDDVEKVRGMIVASDFDKKSIAAARFVPDLKLVKYSVSFLFASVE